MHAYIHTYRHTYIHTCIHIDRYIHTSIYMHHASIPIKNIDAQCHDITKLAGEGLLSVFCLDERHASRPCIPNETVLDRRAGRASALDRILFLPSRSAKNLGQASLGHAGQPCTSLVCHVWQSAPGLGFKRSPPAASAPPSATQVFGPPVCGSTLSHTGHP